MFPIFKWNIIIKIGLQVANIAKITPGAKFFLISAKARNWDFCYFDCLQGLQTFNRFWELLLTAAENIGKQRAGPYC